MIEVRQPVTAEEWTQYYELHYRVLREPLHMPRMDEEIMKDQAFVYGAAFQDGKVVSIARVKKVPAEGEKTGQVRGVATDPEYLRKGYGKAVMDFVEAESRNTGLDYLFLNARINAVDFYLRLGYTIEKGIGEYLPSVPHFRMGKWLVKSEELRVKS